MGCSFFQKHYSIGDINMTTEQKKNHIRNVISKFPRANTKIINMLDENQIDYLYKTLVHYRKTVSRVNPFSEKNCPKIVSPNK